MRWPLRLQILTPMAVILLVTVGSVSVLNAWLAATRVRTEVETQLRAVARTLEEGNFPLESNVLRQTSGLSGAELLVVNEVGETTAASFSATFPRTKFSAITDWRELQLSETFELQGQTYFHTGVKLDRRPVGGGLVELHIFYPERAWQQATRQASLGPLLIGGVALVVVSLAAWVVAASLTHPVRMLQTQVQEIARGNYESLPLPVRNDEVRDLATAVNQLAVRLSQYEAEVRGNERLRTLSQLGSGIAHQVRNAATGCRIAIDLHQRECPLTRDDQNSDRLQIAKRQLTLIETHVQRLLALGKPSEQLHERIELGALLDDTLELVRPTATHLGAELQVSTAWPNAATEGDGEALQQMLVNVLINAIQATTNGGKQETHSARVILEATLIGSTLTIAVGDNGPGLPDHVAERLFQPFQSDKPGGTGLGLSVARHTARLHGGDVRWSRIGDLTWFYLELPNWHGWNSDR
ncbi:Sporulation kinase E [Anatilimnocola aggregata]|uniref:histidine kinase n=1 Tax=Anatilimnocola aggregata TaxID=2528021 RepID=A0A517YJQ5_9BACT|nr:HAMP domain-containing sensor histidine kinase [Anatilimnocola aggregata]QDU30442.1 Sporulation kinase E [Anatilimnocola aggregata]